MNFIIADDHPFTLNGTVAFVKSLGHTVVDTAQNGTEALRLINKWKPELAILDINMPGLNGLELLEQIHLNCLPVKVICVTSHNEMSIYKKAIEYGAMGYVLKNYAEVELENCINTIAKGKSYVSPKLNGDLTIDKSYIKNEALRKLSFIEAKILELIAQQKTTKAIAELLFMSEKTVEGHRANIIAKLNLPQEKNALMKWAISNL